MKAILIILTNYLVGLSIAQSNCPPAQALLPCTCDYFSEEITCNNIQAPFNLKEIFDNASIHVRDGVVFPSLMLLNLPITEIGDDTVEYLQFERIFIRLNRNLQYISPRAFPASGNVTTRLDMYMNNITNEAPGEGDIFELVRSFPNLTHVTMSYNRVSSIPANAFQNLNQLEVISLLNNSISTIGSKAFPTGAENLNLIEIANNPITSEGIAVDAFDGISNLTYFLMQCTQVDTLEQRKFQNVLNQTANVWAGKEFSCPSGRRFQCDGRADWICDNEASYRPKLFGFECEEGSSFRDVWQYCAGRNATFQLN